MNTDRRLTPEQRAHLVNLQASHRYLLRHAEGASVNDLRKQLGLSKMDAALVVVDMVFMGAIAKTDARDAQGLPRFALLASS